MIETARSGVIREDRSSSLEALAESELAHPGFRLKFPAALEVRYWHDIAAERVKELRFILLWGAALYFGLGIVLNLTIIPNPDWRGVSIQLIGPSLAALVVRHVWLRDGCAAAMREAGLLAICLLCTLAAIFIVAVKPAPATLRDFLLAIPPTSFAMIFVRLRFRQAAILFLANIGAFVLALAGRPEVHRGDAMFLAGFMATILLPSLVGVHAFERAARRIYLHGLLERLRNEKLAASNAALTGLSYTDSLTGIPNRRQLDQALSAFLAVPGSAGALLLIDIDMFKAFNDRHGHLAGDTCLRQIAQCLGSCLQPLDQLARFGGEEFVVLLPQATSREAAQSAEALREAVQRLRFSVQGQSVGITVSIGVAAREGLDTPQALIGAADAALYAAKRAGRNRVLVA
ncbi:GGDEF domain-containing protein [Bordetella sp. FB-8]|uniref:GGDEF domain-containing protein n=1 Tax=Bordetella sp. FB-8 TaxID=1159870 RepID=UPI0018C95ADA|nr:GGDEF domain-containing protein [Bordetella sp. FB-8]